MVERFWTIIKRKDKGEKILGFGERELKLKSEFWGWQGVVEMVVGAGAALIEDNGFLSQLVLSKVGSVGETQHSVIDRCSWNKNKNFDQKTQICNI